MDDQPQIYDNAAEEEARKKRARAILNAYIQNRIAFYDGTGSSPMTYERLLGKDFAIYALRGVETAEDYAREAFHAVESSSEETAMGTRWQELIASIAENAIDTGDLTATRDGAVYVIELKSQENTTNSSSFPNELRSLRQRMREIAGRKRASHQKVEAAICITRSTISKDEWRTFDVGFATQENADLKDFRYRYLSGTAMWQWLCGIDSPYGLIRPFSKIDSEPVLKARESSLERVTQQLLKELDRKGLPHTLDGVAELSDSYKAEKEAKRREREAKKRNK
ncbi:PmeII family type II restriction endonuclease [Bifidobacterium anseris]|nr:PmeII family type II restriction endonuclease [Bifidobacterium anseris]